jgi:hypothetical protein
VRLFPAWHWCVCISASPLHVFFPPFPHPLSASSCCLIPVCVASVQRCSHLPPFARAGGRGGGYLTWGRVHRLPRVYTQGALRHRHAIVSSRSLARTWHDTMLQWSAVCGMISLSRLLTLRTPPQRRSESALNLHAVDLTLDATRPQGETRTRVPSSPAPLGRLWDKASVLGGAPAHQRHTRRVPTLLLHTASTVALCCLARSTRCNPCLNASLTLPTCPPAPTDGAPIDAPRTRTPAFNRDAQRHPTPR